MYTSGTTRGTGRTRDGVSLVVVEEEDVRLPIWTGTWSSVQSRALAVERVCQTLQVVLPSSDLLIVSLCLSP